MKKFENILIVTDLDGTFLSGDSVPQRNIQAIEYFKQNGGHFTVASGRVFEHIIAVIPNIRELANAPLITSNGACIYDAAADRIVEKNELPFDIVKEIAELVACEFPKVGIRAGAHEYCFMFTPESIKNPYLSKDYERYKHMNYHIKPLCEWQGMPILKLVLRADGDVLDRLVVSLEERFGDKIFARKSWETVIDVQIGCINKGRAVRTLCQRYLPEGKKIYACGDYINDTDMLLAADVSVCPSGAHEYIKSISDMCLCSNDDGLIGALVEYLDTK